MVDSINPQLVSQEYKTHLGNLKNPYARVSNFIPVDNDMVDPVQCCVADNPFYCSGMARPGSWECRSFMSDRCAQKWDEWCDVSFFNTHFVVPNENTRVNTPEREILLRDTLEKRYCKRIESNIVENDEPLGLNGSCNKTCSLFDPTSPQSPSVCNYSGNCLLKCDNIPENINDLDNDPQFKACLDHPEKCEQLLTNMCGFAYVNQRNLAGSRLETICKNINEKNQPTYSTVLGNRNYSNSFHTPNKLPDDLEFLKSFNTPQETIKTPISRKLTSVTPVPVPVPKKEETRSEGHMDIILYITGGIIGLMILTMLYLFIEKKYNDNRVHEMHLASIRNDDI